MSKRTQALLERVAKPRVITVPKETVPAEPSTPLYSSNNPPYATHLPNLGPLTIMVEQAAKDLAYIRSKFEESDNKNQNLSIQLNEKTKQVEQLTNELNVRVKEWEEVGKGKMKELTDVNSRVKDLERELTTKNKELEVAMLSLSARSNELEHLSKDMETARRSVGSLNTALEKKTKDLEEIRKEVEVSRRTIQNLTEK